MTTPTAVMFQLILTLKFEWRQAYKQSAGIILAERDCRYGSKAVNLPVSNWVQFWGRELLAERRSWKSWLRAGKVDWPEDGRARAGTDGHGRGERAANGQRLHTKAHLRAT